MRDKNIHFQVELKEKIYKKMMDICTRKYIFRNTFIRKAIVSNLMFDEDFQKEILSEIGKEENRDFFITMKLNFEAINKFKKEYEECARFVETYLSKGVEKCYSFSEAQTRKERKENYSVAVSWALVSPSGEKYLAINLRNFIRNHADLFGIDGSDDMEVKRVASSFTRLKTNLKKGKISSYHGWTVELPEEQK